MISLSDLVTVSPVGSVAKVSNQQPTGRSDPLHVVMTEITGPPTRNPGVREAGLNCPSARVFPRPLAPLLANVYLHYVLDLWVHWWRRHHAHGEVIIVRWADDFVVGFAHEHDARRFWAELAQRFSQFGLELHPDKTRLIEFGRFAAQRRRRRGSGKPETFDFWASRTFAPRPGTGGSSCGASPSPNGCGPSSKRSRTS